MDHKRLEKLSRYDPIIGMKKSDLTIEALLEIIEAKAAQIKQLS
jgi:hypothetical protein